MLLSCVSVRDESNNKATWTPEEEEELRTLYETHRDYGGNSTFHNFLQFVV